MVPGKSRKYDWHIINAQPACFGEIRDNTKASEIVRGLIVAKPSNGPRADDVERAVDRGPSAFGSGVRPPGVYAQVTPRGRNPAQHRRGNACRLQKVDDCHSLVRSYVAVLESEAPDAHDRLSAMVDVGGAVSDPEVAGQVRPILRDGFQGGSTVHPGNIVHDEEAAPISLGAAPGVAQHDIETASDRVVRQAHRELLHGGAVNVVVLHPAEMARHRLWILVREQIGRCVRRELEVGRATLVGTEFGRVRPLVEGDRVWVLRVAARYEPMAPSHSRSVPGTSIPSLISDDLKAMQTVENMRLGLRGLAPHWGDPNTQEAMTPAKTVTDALCLAPDGGVSPGAAMIQPSF